ncbi:VCBS repeat-containing protein, partial [PVC group bacterium]|nr:VCBS repeat-containing protein [PVC group bacterium]
GTVSVLLADTFGGYLPQVALPVGASPSSIAVVDFDDDGDKDIAIVASNGTGDRVVHVLRNDLNLTDYEDLIFASATELANGENPSMIAYGDLDGDNTTDLVSVSSTSGLRGEVPAMISTRGIEVAQICIGDLNETGEVDVIDLLIVINQWGLANSPADVNFDGIVDVSDLLIVVGNWGPCK